MLWSPIGPESDIFSLAPEFMCPYTLAYPMREKQEKGRKPNYSAGPERDGLSAGGWRYVGVPPRTGRNEILCERVRFVCQLCEAGYKNANTKHYSKLWQNKL